MPKFGRRSESNLKGVHPHLIEIAREVVKNLDCSVLCGRRSEEDQNKLFKAGRSKLKYPESKHNKTPSMAIDIVPYPVDWDDRERFYFFAGFFMGIASKLGYKIRWGGDWDMDNDFGDQNFDDLPHFELVT